MTVRLRKGSDRNVQCHIVSIGPHNFFFSYETCVAYDGPASDQPVRIHNHWGPTTGRHLSDMGVKDWRVLTDEEFAGVLARAMP